MIIECICLEKLPAPLAFDQPKRAYSFVRGFILLIESLLAPAATIGFKQAINLMIGSLFDAYQCSALSIHAHYFSFLAFCVLVGLYISFEERFLTICAINCKKLAYILMLLHILSLENPFTAFHGAINWFFSTILIMRLQLQNRNGCDAIFTLCLEYFHECIVGIGSFDELKLRYITLCVQSLHLNMQEFGFFPHQFSKQAPQKALSQL
jgi:hypothetical protein